MDLHDFRIRQMRFVRGIWAVRAVEQFRDEWAKRGWGPFGVMSYRRMGIDVTSFLLYYELRMSELLTLSRHLSRQLSHQESINPTHHPVSVYSSHSVQSLGHDL